MTKIIKTFKNEADAVKVLENCYNRDSTGSWGKMSVCGGILSAVAQEDRNEHGELESTDIVVVITSNYLSERSIEELFEIED
jgi:hypothetical protein